jgi:hypothetical protein
VTDLRRWENMEKWLEHVPKMWPYRLQWLNEYGEVKVNKQVLIAFSIGKYSNEIMCDSPNAC